MLIIGHRGARFEAPENTLAGFRHALELGLQAVEFDVRMSKDDQLVVIHDATVDRTTDAEGPVESFTLAELQGMDARSQFPDWPEVCTIPTLTEVLDIVGAFSHLSVEIKTDTPERLKRIIPRTLDMIAEAGLTDRAVITSFDVSALELVQRLAPDQRRGYIGAWDSPEYLETARALGAYKGGCRITTGSAAMVKQMHDAGLKAVGWPCNDADAYRTLRAWNVDGLTTDVPTEIRALHEATEREA